MFRYRHGVDLLFSSGILEIFLDIFNILNIFALNKSETSNISLVIDYIFTCYIRVVLCNGEFLSSNIDYLVKRGAISKIVDLLKLDSKEKKEKKDGLCLVLLDDIIILFFNISIEGSLYSEKGKRNTRYSLFDSSTEEILCEIHKLISSQNTSSSSSSSSQSTSSCDVGDLEKKRIINFIPIILINIHKNEKCPPSLLPFLSIVHSMISQPSAIDDVDLPRWLKLAFDGIIDGEKVLN
jgi:hypothetical protein